jgi:hypothetical protein
VLSAAACTRTTERVVEPVGGGDASTTTPEVEEAGVNPIGPIARPVEEDDFRLVRAPEFGVARDAPRQSSFAERQGAGGGINAGGGAGLAGDLRPVGAGGNY